MSEWLLADAAVPNVLMLIIVAYVACSIGWKLAAFIAELFEGDNL